MRWRQEGGGGGNYTCRHNPKSHPFLQAAVAERLDEMRARAASGAPAAAGPGAPELERLASELQASGAANPPCAPAGATPAPPAPPSPAAPAPPATPAPPAPPSPAAAAAAAASDADAEALVRSLSFLPTAMVAISSLLAFDPFAPLLVAHLLAAGSFAANRSPCRPPTDHLLTTF
jgi:hypothetical protein